MQENPTAAYRSRLDDRQGAVAAHERNEHILGWLRLAIFAAGVATAWPALFTDSLHPGWIGLPVAAFLVALVAHDRVIRARVRAERAARFYRRGLARLEDRWAGDGSDGRTFRDPDHAYSSDLDLFGHASLFELLCAARTAGGEQRLAGWLGQAADPAEIRDRQEAVRELTGSLDLREDLAVLGDDVREAVDPAALVAWSEAPVLLTERWPAIASLILGLANFVSLVLYFTWRPEPFVISALVSLFLSGVFLLRARRVLEAVGRPERDLAVLSEILGRLECERFRSPRLMRLQGALESEGDLPSRRISRLARLVELNDSRRNMFFAPIAGLFLLGTQLAFAMERWRMGSGSVVPTWLEAVGDFEALSSFAALAYERPEYVYPEIAEGGAVLVGEALAHPLLPADAVANDVSFAGGLQLMLVSGSNMSGKSTMLRTIGVNVSLALAGAPVRASRLVVSPMSIGACLRVQDSLQQGHSHFYAEIKRLKCIVDLGGGERPLLFLLDEILHGTNSHDRRLGAAALIRSLVERGGIGLVTTHDLALTHIADDLGDTARNVHFADHLEGDRMVFDYLLQDGVVQKSNALDLMRAIGLEV